MVIVFQKLVVDIVWFVRLNTKNSFKNEKNKKQEIKRSFVGKKILIYLKCNAVKELGRKKKKKKVFWGRGPSSTDMTTAIFADTCCN